jgi:hypothetical protein
VFTIGRRQLPFPLSNTNEIKFYSIVFQYRDPPYKNAIVRGLNVGDIAGIKSERRIYHITIQGSDILTGSILLSRLTYFKIAIHPHSEANFTIHSVSLQESSTCGDISYEVFIPSCGCNSGCCSCGSIRNLGGVGHWTNYGGGGEIRN